MIAQERQGQYGQRLRMSTKLITPASAVVLFMCIHTHREGREGEMGVVRERKGEGDGRRGKGKEREGERRGRKREEEGGEGGRGRPADIHL